MLGEGVGTGKAPESNWGARPLPVLTKREDWAVTRESSQGPVPVDAETVEWARREGEVVGLSQGPPPEAPPLGEFKRAIPRAVRRYVDARDGDRCCFPGCTHRADLEADHFDGWENGHDPGGLGSSAGRTSRAWPGLLPRRDGRKRRAAFLPPRRDPCGRRRRPEPGGRAGRVRYHELRRRAGRPQAREGAASRSAAFTNATRARCSLKRAEEPRRTVGPPYTTAPGS